jgi:hypothetical protein
MDPFDTTGNPDFYRNLMQFGFGAMSAGAQPGATTLGALGQAGAGTMEAAQKAALARAQSEYYGQNTLAKKMENDQAIAGQKARKEWMANAGMMASPTVGGDGVQQQARPSADYKIQAVAFGPYEPDSPEQAMAAMDQVGISPQRQKYLENWLDSNKFAADKARSTLPYDVARSAAGATRVNVNNAQETEEAKTVGKAFGDDYVKMIDAGKQAQSKIANYDRMNQLLDGVETGKFKGTTTDLKAAAKSMGIDLEALGIKDDVAPVQAAQAMTNEMALQLRNPSSGGGMPGALSNSDRDFLASMTPGVEKTKEGRALMTETAKKLAKRDMQISKMARDYRSKHGKIDEAFYSSLADYSEQNPLFKTPTPTDQSGVMPKVIHFNDLPD